MSIRCLVIVATLFLQPATGSPGERYIAQMTAAMQEGATPADVERVLALFTADAVYEHPAFGVRIAGIAAMRAGRLAQLGITRHAHAEIRGRTGLAGSKLSPWNSVSRRGPGTAGVVSPARSCCCSSTGTAGLRASSSTWQT